MKKRICYEALEFLRNNPKVSDEEMREKYGREGITMKWVLQSHLNDIKKLEKRKITNDVRSETIDLMLNKVQNGEITVEKDYEKGIEIGVMVFSIIIISIFALFLGSAFLILIPPIWIIILLLFWIIKKL